MTTVLEQPEKIGTQKQPKYQVLSEQLRAQIESRELLPGERLPSFAEMREHFGVTTTTVERVFSILASEGLVERRARSGVYVTQPNMRGVHDVVAFACSAFTEYRHHPYFIELFRGIQHTLEKENVHLMLGGGQNDSTFWDRVGGVLFYESVKSMKKRVATLPPGMPAILLLERDEDNSFSSVTADDYSGAYQATKYLLAQGHRRIACLISDNLPVLQRRLKAYRDALGEAGIQIQPQWRRDVEFHEQSYDFVEAGRNIMHHWLKQDWKELGCTALMCLNDEVAVGAMQSLNEAGILVPRDVSVFGFDDQRVCTLVSPSISTVRVPVRQVGARAAQLLLEQMRSGHNRAREVQSIVLPVELKLRGSTASINNLTEV